MRKIIILQFALFLFCFYNCKENSGQIRTNENQTIKDTFHNVNDETKNSYFKYKKWSLIDNKEGIYQFSEFSIKLKNDLDDKKNIGGKKAFLNNQEIDFIITDAYVLTPFLFIDNNNEKIVLIQEEDEGGIYGYILYYFINDKFVKREYLDISPVNQIEIDKFINFKNDNNTIRTIILTDEYYDTKTEKIESSNQFNFIFNKTKNDEKAKINLNNKNDDNSKYSFYGVWKLACTPEEKISNIFFNNEKEGYLYIYDKTKLVTKMMIELSSNKSELQYVGTNIIGEGVDTSKLSSLKKGKTIAKFEVKNNNLIIFWNGFSEDKFLTKNPFSMGNSTILKKCSQ